MNCYMAEKIHSLSLFRQYRTDASKGIERTFGMGMHSFDWVLACKKVYIIIIVRAEKS